MAANNRHGYAWDGTKWIDLGQLGVAGPEGTKWRVGGGGTSGMRPGDLYVDLNNDVHVVQPNGQAGPAVVSLGGPKGATGDTGSVGPTGPQGPRGNTGPVSNVPGPVGHIGPTGPMGQGITVKGTVANAGVLPAGALVGDTYVTMNDNHGHVSDGAGGWVDIGPLRGPQGLTGATGPAGVAGIQGGQGQDGQDGPTGPTGPTGDTGENARVHGDQHGARCWRTVTNLLGGTVTFKSGDIVLVIP